LVCNTNQQTPTPQRRRANGRDQRVRAVIDFEEILGKLKAELDGLIEQKTLEVV